MGALKVSTKPLICVSYEPGHVDRQEPENGGDDEPRLISKEHAKLIADAGGVVGVWTKLTGSVTEFVESIQMMVDAIGMDHAGIGSDNDLLSGRVGAGPRGDASKGIYCCRDQQGWRRSSEWGV